MCVCPGQKSNPYLSMVSGRMESVSLFLANGGMSLPPVRTNANVSTG